MRLLAIPILLLAGCQTAGQRSPLADWFAGDCAFVESDRPNPCEEGIYGSYYPDGTYRFVGERGTWSFEGDRLTETATAIDPRNNVQPASDVGVPYVSTIERLSDDRMLKILPQRRVEFVRCRVTGPRRADDLG